MWLNNHQFNCQHICEKLHSYFDTVIIHEFPSCSNFIEMVLILSSRCFDIIRVCVYTFLQMTIIKDIRIFCIYIYIYIYVFYYKSKFISILICFHSFFTLVVNKISQVFIYYTAKKSIGQFLTPNFLKKFGINVVIMCMSDFNYNFHIKTMFGSSLPQIVCRRAHVFIYIICVCLRIVVSNAYCVVFLRLVSPVLPVSLDCPFFVAPSVFSTFIAQWENIVDV
jgi:hypothetical protein